MVEQKLNIQETNKNGKIYKGIDLKGSAKRGTTGLDDGNYIIVEKVYPEGKEFASPILKDFQGNPVVSYSCAANYDGVQVSFWLNPKEHAVYKECGGVGDKVKITLKEEKKINKKTGAKMLVNVLSFEKVE